VQRRPFAECRLERPRVQRRDRDRVERPDPAPQLERAGEGLLDGDLLVEGEPDEQGKRVGGQESVRLRVAGERQAGRGVVISRW
jgi:hypothetical protein